MLYHHDILPHIYVIGISILGRFWGSLHVQMTYGDGSYGNYFYEMKAIFMYFFSAYSVSATVLGTVDSVVNRRSKWAKQHGIGYAKALWNFGGNERTIKLEPKNLSQFPVSHDWRWAEARREGTCSSSSVLVFLLRAMESQQNFRQGSNMGNIIFGCLSTPK